jgi:hypothetical protein
MKHISQIRETYKNFRRNPAGKRGLDWLKIDGMITYTSVLNKHSVKVIWIYLAKDKVQSRLLQRDRNFRRTAAE